MHKHNQNDPSPVVVIDVGGGSLVLYVNGAKVASPAYSNDEYETFCQKENWSAEPLLLLMQTSFNLIRHDRTLKGRFFKVKVGITGSARVDLTEDDLKLRVQHIHSLCYEISSARHLECGILSHHLVRRLLISSDLLPLLSVDPLSCILLSNHPRRQSWSRIPYSSYWRRPFIGRRPMNL
jgi:hypothetical protein